MPVEPGDKRPTETQSSELQRLQQQRAPIAQLLLVARLRARNRRDLARDSLERAANVIFVTCKNWFSLGRDVAAKDSPPAVVKAEENSEHVKLANVKPALAPTPLESPHAHRHD